MAGFCRPSPPWRLSPGPNNLSVLRRRPSPPSLSHAPAAPIIPPASAMDFDPGSFLASPAPRPEWDLLILNQPLQDFAVFSRLWSGASYRICADGAANRLYDMFDAANGTDRAAFIPTAIHGDLDSLREDAREYYSARGAEVSKDPDQYSTDFGKAMSKILASPKDTVRDVVVLGSLGGRVDHGLGILHEMMVQTEKQPALRFWLFSEASVSFILPKGESRIHVPLSQGRFTQNVGIIPIYGPGQITTSGLEWDVTDWETRMNGQVSSSNHIVDDVVVIRTNEYMLFTVERK